jgi:aldehyde dehydrogenase (NAD+)
LPPQDGIYEEFVEKAAAKAAARTVGDPWSAGVQQGPQVGYSHFHNLMGFISKKMPNNIL